ncbi:MAG: hypothetical protein R6V50_04970 [Thermoplasmatota archaeon]
MNDRTKLLAGILVFGSLWGFSECIIGPMLSNAELPSGLFMSAIFAMFFLTISRLMYKTKGMQTGMGLVAGTLRFFNPFGACHICSAIAIGATGLIYEIIVNKLTPLDLRDIKSLTTKVGLGILTGYSVYVGGYFITQILTPLSFGSFYIQNFIVALPSILAAGLPAALLGGTVLPATLQISKLDLKLADRLYYPVTIGVSMFCWIVVITNFLMIT